MAVPIPQTIDRFEVQGVLGEGSQGIVYLASDPELQRRVAIKSVGLKYDLGRDDGLDRLVSEARTASRLQHANVVSIFDIGVHEQRPYIVLEYIDGKSLHQVIADAPDLERSLQIMRDVLEGVAAAHAEDIVHCDIKPANILISDGGRAKVADFGLACLADLAIADQTLQGTPKYMAPEYLESHRHRKVSDVFSIGLVAYELFTGQAAFNGKDVYQVMHAIANTEPAQPSGLNPGIDDRLEAWLLKALCKNPDERYADAGAMLLALNDYLSLDDTAPRPHNADATASFLLRRIRHKKDFPAFSHTISVLNQASASDTENLTSISNTILRDYSLTNKVLRLVNSAYYNRGGGKISTISRAVVMLGLNPVRSIATGLMLFEQMQNKMQSTQLKEQAVQALFSGLLASSLARQRQIPQPEEAFLCALLQQLGRMLVRFYLPEEAQAVDKLVLQQDCSEDAAAKQVLGTTFPRLGMSVAREWGFPDLITDSMQPLDFDKLPKKAGAEERLHPVAQFSNALAASLTLPLQQQAPAINRLTRQFSTLLDLDGETVSALLENCHKELTQFSRLIQFDLEKSIYYQQISSSGDEVPEITDASARSQELGVGDSVEILVEQESPPSRGAEQVLSDGIQDITNTLAGDYGINQVLQMILETIYRAFDGVRVVLCLRDAEQGQVRARFGYGPDVDAIIEHFAIPLQPQPDVFHVAFKNDVDIRIENTSDEKIRGKIPRWYHEHIAARSFTLFPIVINNSPLALIYIDSVDDDGFRISDNQLSLLKTLRNQAILAIRNRA